MKNIWKLILIFVAIFLQLSLSAQDPGFSQFYSNPIYLNPVFAGTAAPFRVVVNHRQQYGGDIGRIISAFSVDGKLNSDRSGWGVQVINDHQFGGILKNTMVNGTLAHRIPLNKKSEFGVGLQFGFYQKQLNWDGLTFEDQLDPRYGMVNVTQEQFGRSKVVNPNVSIGAMYLSERMIAGMSVNHVNRPKEDFGVDTGVQLPIKYTLYVGSIFNVNNYRQRPQVLSPNIIYERQGTQQYLNLGMYYSINAIVLGAFYRLNESLIFSFGISNEKIKIGYSYDAVIAKYASTSGNSHEISATILIHPVKKFKVKGRYKGQCPNFYKYML